MIVSHKHRYLFIEIPLTGSWAVRCELCDCYGGEPILHKHASYPEFRRIATRDQADYFVFATIRNPLDVAVSRYFKLKTNHKGAFTDREALEALQVDSSDLKKYDFAARSDATFADYFARYHTRPFYGMINVSRNDVDMVMRQETLQDDFASVLDRLGLEQVRPIPVANPTQGRSRQWQSYYTSELVEQAKQNFGPFMHEWGYTFPDGWGSFNHTWAKELEYRLLGMAAKMYLVHFRYSKSFFAKTVRSMRALVTK